MNYVEPLVAVLVPPGREHVERTVEVERIAREEVPHHELVNPLLALAVQHLKLVRGGEAFDVQAIRQERIGGPAEEVLGFERGNAGHGRKHVRCPGRGPLQRMAMAEAVCVRNAASVDIGQMVVQIDVRRTEAAPDERRVRREDGRQRRPPMTQHRQRRRALPFVKMRQQRAVFGVLVQRAQEVSDDRPEADDLIELVITLGRGDAVVLPQVVLDLGQPVPRGAHVHQQHLRPARNEPAAEVDPHARVRQIVNCRLDRTGRFLWLELDAGRVLAVRPDEKVRVTPAMHRRWRLAAQHRVNPAYLRANLPGHFEQQRRLRRRLERDRSSGGRPGRVLGFRGVVCLTHVALGPHLDGRISDRGERPARNLPSPTRFRQRMPERVAPTHERAEWV